MKRLTPETPSWAAWKCCNVVPPHDKLLQENFQFFQKQYPQVLQQRLTVDRGGLV